MEVGWLGLKLQYLARGFAYLVLGLRYALAQALWALGELDGNHLRCLHVFLCEVWLDQAPMVTKCEWVRHLRIGGAWHFQLMCFSSVVSQC